MAKKYAEFSAEEKAIYKAKRDAYWQKREEDLSANFKKLKAEIEALKITDAQKQTVLQLIAKCESKKSEGKANRETYLTAIFETETPKVGQVATFLQVGVRGPNGERIMPKETIAQFVTRCKDAIYKYDANTISSMAWYLRKRGHIVEIDKKKATVTYVKFDANTISE